MQRRNAIIFNKLDGSENEYSLLRSIFITKIHACLIILVTKHARSATLTKLYDYMYILGISKERQNKIIDAVLNGSSYRYVYIRPRFYIMFIHRYKINIPLQFDEIKRMQ